MVDELQPAGWEDLLKEGRGLSIRGLVGVGAQEVSESLVNISSCFKQGRAKFREGYLTDVEWMCSNNASG